MPKKKHILVVSQYFYPEPFRINDICSEWVKRGYQVTGTDRNSKLSTRKIL